MLSAAGHWVQGLGNIDICQAETCSGTDRLLCLIELPIEFLIYATEVPRAILNVKVL